VTSRRIGSVPSGVGASAFGASAGSAETSTRRNRPVSKTRLRACSHASGRSGSFEVRRSARSMTSASIDPLPAMATSDSTWRGPSMTANLTSSRGSLARGACRTATADVAKPSRR
jgi:hypothetical protein